MWYRTIFALGHTSDHVGSQSIQAYKHFKDDGWDHFVGGTEIPVVGAPKLSAEILMICTHELRGYALESKKWGFFNVDCVEDMKFNSEAFQGLLFEEPKKRLIRSLVSQHGSEGDDFDDLIEGKGKGLMFLLYGPPGVGTNFIAGKYLHRTPAPRSTAGGHVHFSINYNTRG